ncbi:signal peptidase I [Actinoplanes sp. NEAU-A12]|uniref:Signal peptidase I n=1 Tax=Actinoplanes sandaracinus TaxID=3045177 RepID=A0ABT6X1Y4_9ACTN|nr:signal peptidase I [Actinoplanes sandaracinus]MDI6106046.1 signal peptidase I [Actinoplanes sandaracinus]
MALLSLVAVMVLSGGAGLVIWTLIPAMWGWSPSVVLTGSMRPAVEPGDVVVSAPVRGDRLKRGYIVRFEDPDEPGQYVMHRIVEIDSDGALVTKGDSNPSADSTTVPPANVTGMGRLRVPWVGLPAVWWQERQYVRVGIAAAVLSVCCAAVPAGWNWNGPAPRTRKNRADLPQNGEGDETHQDEVDPL